MASVLFLGSWAVMMGPMVYARHLISAERLPFTATYFGSIGLTLYFALGLHSTILTLMSSIVQFVALLWYLVSYFPMGSTGLRFAASFGSNRVAAWMNG
ncbi:Protein transport protein sft2 [Elasticomyces elasticus]|nr:Protein transport protein sft2 [Elasticomyces elasticus]KAK5733442.1 Protein transport protein sft2 [Elasticomyces elasticus]